MRFAIELNSLSKQYFLNDGSSFQAVDNLTLQVPLGQVIGFLGPNGAGKTTTIKMICDIITPTSGMVTLNGFSVKANRSAALSQVGAVLEGTRNTYWQLTPWQNLLYFGRLKGVHTAALKTHAEHILRTLGMWEIRAELVSELSRGTQQKVAIACALITDPPILLLDEPTLGLDVKASRTIKQWIGDLAKNHNKAVVLTTHQLDIAEQLCERIVIMDKGKIIADKPTQDLLQIVHEEHYQITVARQIHDVDLLLPGMKKIEKDGHTLFVGAIVSQDELYEKLSMIHHLKLPLVSVSRTKNNLEDVFMHLTHTGEKFS
jgi:ABC-2 type transport system ATP-binding protein